MRIKVGVGSNECGDMVKHVLGKFGSNERKIVDEAVRNATSAAELMIIEDINTAMNRYN